MITKIFSKFENFTLAREQYFEIFLNYSRLGLFHGHQLSLRHIQAHLQLFLLQLPSHRFLPNVTVYQLLDTHCRCIQKYYFQFLVTFFQIHLNNCVLIYSNDAKNGFESLPELSIDSITSEQFRTVSYSFLQSTVVVIVCHLDLVLQIISPKVWNSRFDPLLKIRSFLYHLFNYLLCSHICEMLQHYRIAFPLTI